jgi:hypothetical protein
VPTKLKALPFDDRNNSDFEAMTVRIRQGLETIRNNKSLPATQTTLAKLAQCSRKTLSLRRWPIDELKRIKVERNSKHKDAEEKIPKQSGNEENRERQLIKQVRNYQDQNGRLFDQVQHLQEQKSNTDLITSTLEQQVIGLTEEVRRLEKELRKTKLAAVEGPGRGQEAQV